MTKESTDTDTYSVQTVAKAGEAPVSLEAFLIGKLGQSTGKRLYKDLGVAVKDVTGKYNGSPAILLDTKRGDFAVLTDAN
jgi:hypothetical protein